MEIPNCFIKAFANNWVTGLSSTTRQWTGLSLNTICFWLVESATIEAVGRYKVASLTVLALEILISCSNAKFLNWNASNPASVWCWGGWVCVCSRSSNVGTTDSRSSVLELWK